VRGEAVLSLELPAEGWVSGLLESIGWKDTLCWISDRILVTRRVLIRPMPGSAVLGWLN